MSIINKDMIPSSSGSRVALAAQDGVRHSLDSDMMMRSPWLTTPPTNCKIQILWKNAWCPHPNLLSMVYICNPDNKRDVGLPHSDSSSCLECSPAPAGRSKALRGWDLFGLKMMRRDCDLRRVMGILQQNKKLFSSYPNNFLWDFLGTRISKFDDLDP